MKLTIFILISLLGRILFAQEIVSWNEQVQVIKKFYDFIEGEYNPTVQDFNNIFSPHDESELKLIYKDCKLKGLSEYESIKYGNEVYSSPDDYISLVFKKLRKNKDLIFPVNTKYPKNRIFVCIETSNLEKDKFGQIYGEVNIEVVFKNQNNKFESLFFQLDTMPINAQYGSFIINIFRKDSTSVMSLILVE